MPQDRFKPIEVMKMINAFTAADPSEIAAEDRLGKEMSLFPAAENVRRLIEFYELFDISGLMGFSEKQLALISDITEENHKTLGLLAKFKAPDGNIERTRLLDFVENRLDTTYNELGILGAICAARRTDSNERLSKLEEGFQNSLSEWETTVEELKGEQIAAKQESDEILEAMRKAAAEIGVSQHAGHFQSEAKAHGTAAKLWMGVTIGLAITLVATAGLFLFFRNVDLLKAANGVEAAQLIFVKALVFGTLSFALVFAARNYFANRHNVVVNRHRTNALSTYTALVKQREKPRAGTSS